MRFLAWIGIGVIAGWLTGLIVKGQGYGLIGDLVVGLLGGLIGGWLFHLFGWAARSWLAETIVAAVGGIVLVTLVRLLRRLGYKLSTS